MAANDTKEAEGSSINLFTPYKMGNLSLSHRIVMAPLTRCKAWNSIPNSAMAKYYSQRATQGGLLISEATSISRTAIGYPRVPGIYMEEHVDEWKKVVDAVHAKEGIFFCQLWHVGRASHTANFPFCCLENELVYQPKGEAPVSSTNKPISSRWKIMMPDGTQSDYSQPRTLDTTEILEIVDQYRQAAINAMKAGFDGVEIHAAYGYLIDQFLKDGINDRTDVYGGSIDNRCRFLIEIVESIASAIGAERIGIKISPTNYCQDAHDSDPLALGLAIAEKLNGIQRRFGSKLAYIHAQVGSIDGMNEKEAVLFRKMKESYQGSFMIAGGFTKESGNKVLEARDADLIAFGRLFISNPDLVYRFRIGADRALLNEYDPSTFYSQDSVVGYTDYPFLDRSIH